MEESKPILNFNLISPLEAGMDNTILLEMGKFIQSHHKNITGIVVVYQNKVVLETYYNDGSVNDASHVASVTKSIISALIGIAIDKGFIKSIDQNILDFFPEYVCPPAEIQKKAITIRHLLTMRAPYAFKASQEPLEKLTKQKDWLTFSLDMLGKNGHIGAFKYSTCGVHILSAIITRTTKMSAREFANTYLFQAIDIPPIADNPEQTFDYEGLFGERLKGWAKDPDGISTGGWGLALTTRDMARFGMLYLNNGCVNHQQILSNNWIKESLQGECLEKKLPMSFNKYGYLWCIYNKNDIFAYMALGDGGNMICCIPQEEIVVAINADTKYHKARDRWELIENYIIPSIIKTKS